MPHSAGDQVPVCMRQYLPLLVITHSGEPRVSGLQWVASGSGSEHDLDVQFLCFPKSWGFDDINTLVFALMPYPNRALFIPRAPYFITPDLKHRHEARSCYCVLFCVRLDPR